MNMRDKEKDREFSAIVCIICILGMLLGTTAVGIMAIMKAIQ